MTTSIKYQTERKQYPSKIFVGGNLESFEDAITICAPLFGEDKSFILLYIYDKMIIVCNKLSEFNESTIFKKQNAVTMVTEFHFICCHLRNISTQARDSSDSLARFSQMRSNAKYYFTFPGTELKFLSKLWQTHNPELSEFTQRILFCSNELRDVEYTTQVAYATRRG